MNNDIFLCWGDFSNKPTRNIEFLCEAHFYSPRLMSICFSNISLFTMLLLLKRKKWKAIAVIGYGDII